MLVVNVALSFAVPQIGVDPTEKDYGEVVVGESSGPQTFEVTNEGDGVLFVFPSLVGTNPDEFEFEGDTGEPFFVVPGVIHDVIVLFKPTSEGSKDAILRLISSDPDTPTFDAPLSGIGVIPAPDIAVDPESWDYGTVDIPIYDVTSANYSDKTFVVTNEGELTLDISSTDLSDTDNFSILSGGGSFSLEPGETHDIVVRFDPILPGGAKSATLSIVSNDPDESPLDVSLSGTGRVLDLTPPEIISHSPQDGSILNIEPQDIEIVFDEPMDTESVLKNSEFVRINITDDVTEMQASICTFLYWFGDPDQADKYDSYGCQGPYGISQGEAGMVDVTFNEERDTLDIHIEDITVGQPNQPATEDTEYRLTILINGATDDAGNTLALAHIDYTYFLTQQEPVTTGEQSLTLLHDGSLTVNIPAGALSGDTTLTAYTHFYPTATLPAPLWGEFGKIGFIKAFHLELESESIVSPIELQVQYNEGDIPGGADEESLRLYQRDGDRWALLVPSIADTGNNIVSYDNVTELGDFAVMWGYPYGDVNNPVPDSVIDLLDAQAIIQDWVGFRPIWDDGDPDMSDIVANVNGDGTIDLLDAQVLVQIWAGLLDHPPVLDLLIAPINISYSPSVTHTAFLSSDTVSNKVSVILDDATDVFTADVELTYDARLLKIVKVSKTSLTSDSVIEYNDKNVGKLRFALVNGLALSGTGSLADVQFELMPGANSTDAFESIKLTKVELNAGLIKTALGKVPQKLMLLQNYPNPFNPETWIPYELNQTSDVEVLIYNINGQIVRRLRLGQQIPGSYITKDKAAYWDGANAKGEKVSSGVYFYQLKAGEKSFVRKMVIIK